jgi:hypothetical protein
LSENQCVERSAYGILGLALGLRIWSLVSFLPVFWWVNLSKLLLFSGPLFFFFCYKEDGSPHSDLVQQRKDECRVKTVLLRYGLSFSVNGDALQFLKGACPVVIHVHAYSDPSSYHSTRYDGLHM